jgi:hypothetical protein
MDSELEQKPLAPRRSRNARALWRMTSWGTFAALALAGAVLITQTDVGARRLQLAFAPEAVTPPRAVAQAGMAPPAIQKREDNKEAEALRLQAQRLEAQVRQLAADRDRLNARVASLEHNLNDMTGSIKHEMALIVATTPPTPAPAVSRPEMVAPQAEAAGAKGESRAVVGDKPRAALEGRPDARPQADARLETKAEPKPEAKLEPAAKPAEAAAEPQPNPQPMPQAIPQSPPQTIEIVPLPPVRVAAAMASVSAGESGKPELGIDLGGAHTMEILNARWIAVKANFGPLIEGMSPLVAHDRRANVIPYRLIVGPLTNGAAAAQLCKRFAASHVICRTTRYAGDALTQP